jgi:hypothetical protein
MAQQHTAQIRQTNIVGEAVGVALNAIQGLSVHTATIAHSLAALAGAGAAKASGRATGAANDYLPPAAS